MPWRAATEVALYGPDGFYRRHRPASQFRTSVHASPLLAQALADLARTSALPTVVDVGAGGGELLADLHRLAPELSLVGVDVGGRPKVGGEISVTVHYTSHTDLPLVGVLFPDPDLHATSVMRVEK